MVVNKASGTLSLTSNVVINNNLTITTGTLDIDTFRLNRFTEGGTFIMGSGAILSIKGAGNFPSNYITNTLNASSTVNYYGTVSQAIASLITYGNLAFSNGGTAAKTMSGNIRVNGNLLVNSGATFTPGIHSVTLYGNLTNSGTFTAGSSTVNLNGTSKTITGTTTFNNLSLITGSYTVSTGTISMSGDLYIESTGSLNFGTNTASLDGDLTNKGSLVSNGTSTFTGTRVQTIQLLNAITSSSTGIINFNGSVSPIINSSSSPSYATVNINNTGGITASVPWFVFVAMNVASGSTFNGGPLTHTFYGNFTNNGTVTSSGKLKFSPGTPYSASGTVRLDGTAFTSTGEVEFGGTAPLTILQVSPGLNIVNVTNTHSSGVTAPGSWTIADELRIGPGAIFNGGAATSHLISGSMLNNGTFEGQTSTVRFDGAPAEINGLGTYNFNHIKIESTGDLTLNKSINVKQNFILDGLFTGEGRTVNFNGTLASSITGTAGAVVFGDLAHSKSNATTTLLVPVNVTGDLEMIDGKIMTTATNILTIDDGGTSTSGNASSFVSGPMKKVGNDAFVFPVGKGSSWARLGISAPSSVTDEFTAQYFNTAYSNTSTMAGSPSPVIVDVSLVEYWTCDRTVGSSSVTVELFWENSLSGINNYGSDLVVARWNGSAWENKGQSTIAGSTPGSVTSNAVSSFSPFTFGSLSSLVNPLPVKLLNFEERLNDNREVAISWKTASEINNDFFTIERSSNGIDFIPVLKVKGAGNSSVVQSYKAMDAHPLKGVSYYRLKQTDIYGHYEYSQLAMIINTDAGAPVLVYPNPASEVLNIDLGETQDVIVSIRDIAGHVIYSSNAGVGRLSLDVSAYQRGIYIISIETPGGSSQLRFTKI